MRSSRPSAPPASAFLDPAGAYYVMTDIRDVARPGEDDVAFAHRLIADPGVETMSFNTSYAAVATAASIDALAPKRRSRRYGRCCFGPIALTASYTAPCTIPTLIWSGAEHRRWARESRRVW